MFSRDGGGFMLRFWDPDGIALERGFASGKIDDHQASAGMFARLSEQEDAGGQRGPARSRLHLLRCEAARRGLLETAKIVGLDEKQDQLEQAIGLGANFPFQCEGRLPFQRPGAYLVCHLPGQTPEGNRRQIQRRDGVHRWRAHAQAM